MNNFRPFLEWNRRAGRAGFFSRIGRAALLLMILGTVAVGAAEAIGAPKQPLPSGSHLHYASLPLAFQPKYSASSCGSAVSSIPCFESLVSELNPTVSALVYSSYMGGSAALYPDSCAASYNTVLGNVIQQMTISGNVVQEGTAFNSSGILVDSRERYVTYPPVITDNSPTSTGAGTRFSHLSKKAVTVHPFDVKRYGALGDDSADDTASFTAAYDAMPSCNLAGTVYSHCGTVFLPEGVYMITSEILIDSAGATIRGAGDGATKIDCHTSTACIRYQPSMVGPYQSVQGATFEGFWMDGTNAIAGNGFETIDSQGMVVRDVSVSNFTAGACWADYVDGDMNAQAERREVDITLTNCATQWNMQRTATGGGDTFGYGVFNVKMGISSGQNGIVASGVAGALEFSHSTGNIIGNLGGSGVCIELLNSATFQFSGNVHCEQSAGSGGYLYLVDGTSSLTLNGNVTDPGGRGTLLTSVTPGGSAQIGPKPDAVPFVDLGPCTTEGQHAWVTDSSTAAWGATASGNGPNHVGVVCDGTNWTVYAK